MVIKLLYWFRWWWRSKARLKCWVMMWTCAEVVDALEVLQEKASLAGMTTKSAAKNASG